LDGRCVPPLKSPPSKVRSGPWDLGQTQHIGGPEPSPRMRKAAEVPSSLSLGNYYRSVQEGGLLPQAECSAGNRESEAALIVPVSLPARMKVYWATKAQEAR